jgi:hypothetical protein
MFSETERQALLTAIEQCRKASIDALCRALQLVTPIAEHRHWSTQSMASPTC